MDAYLNDGEAVISTIFVPRLFINAVPTLYAMSFGILESAGEFIEFIPMPTCPKNLVLVSICSSSFYLLGFDKSKVL
jgi:hypothetical protein